MNFSSPWFSDNESKKYSGKTKETFTMSKAKTLKSPFFPNLMLRKQGEEIKHCTCFHGEEHWLKEAGDLSDYFLTDCLKTKAK